jgi:PBP1b-binding outer membrane lipoprotein LpoB
LKKINILLSVLLLSFLFFGCSASSGTNETKTVSTELITAPSTMTVTPTLLGVSEVDIDKVEVSVTNLDTGVVTIHKLDQEGYATIPLEKGKYKVSVNVKANIFVEEN